MLLKISLITLISISSFSIYSQTDTLINNIGKLTVKVVSFKSDSGDCWLALNIYADVYESKDSVWIGKILIIKEKQVIIEIDSLEIGEYAVRVYHDENKNAELDTNFLGIPTEDYGYSNNVSAWFGPPSWEKAKFLFNEEEMLIKIDID